MAKPNYQYEKRQKELAKKKKQEEKRLRKIGQNDSQPQENTGQAPGSANMTPNNTQNS